MFYNNNYDIIDYIFFFNVYDTRYIFAVITPLKRTD